MQLCIWLIHFTYLLSTYCGPERILGAEGRVVEKSEETPALARNKAESKKIKHTIVITGLDNWCERTEGIWGEGAQRSLSKEETLSCCLPEG